jgi:hypothetical protein
VLLLIIMIASLLFSTASAATSTADLAASTTAPSSPLPGLFPAFPPVDPKICKEEELKAFAAKLETIKLEDILTGGPTLINVIGELKTDLCKTDCGKYLAKSLKESFKPKEETAFGKVIKDALDQIDCNASDGLPAPTKVPTFPFPGPFPPVDEKICKKEEYDTLSEKVSKVLANPKDAPGLIKAIGELKPDLCKTDCGKSFAKDLKKTYTPKNETDATKEMKDALAQLDCNHAYITKASLALLLLAVF